MAPRKPQSWAKVRAAGIAANKAKNASATPQSAWTSLNQKNHEHAGNIRALINRKEEEELFGEGGEDGDDEGEEKKEKGRKKGTASKPKPKPKANKVTKPTRKGKATTNKSSTRSTRAKRKTVLSDNDEEDSEEHEFWRPHGGESSNHNQLTSSTCLGLARLTSFQYPDFKAAIEDVLGVYGAGAELETTELVHGGEVMTDVLARFTSEDQAKMIRDQIEWEMVSGRKVQVRFVEE